MQLIKCEARSGATTARRVFDWLMAALSYQGIADQVAYDYMAKHGRAAWHDIDQKLQPRRQLPQAQELLAFPWLPLRKGQRHLCRARSHWRLSAAEP